MRQSEDCHVHDLFADAPAHGGPLLSACYGRAYLDPNREAYELDPAMFDEVLPDHVNTNSLRVLGGLGTIPRIAADGSEVYRDKLTFASAERRIRALYTPLSSGLAGIDPEGPAGAPVLPC